MRGVVRLAKFAGRSPDQLGPEDIRAFQLDLLKHEVSWSLFNQTVCGLRGSLVRRCSGPRTCRRCRSASGRASCRRCSAPTKWFGCSTPPGPAATVCFCKPLTPAACACCELLHLQVGDIDSARMFVIVRQGKGRKDRLVPLSARLLTELRAYWRMHQPRSWLFPGAKADRPLCASTVQRLCKRTRQGAGIDKPATMHTLRHVRDAPAEAGVDVVTLQKMLGHSDLHTHALTCT